MRPILLLLAIPSLAPAQTTNTNCMVNGQWINCTTQGAANNDISPLRFLPPPTPSPAASVPNPTVVTVQNAPADQAMQAAWSHVADLIKEHRCAEAIDFAIRQGGTEAGLRTKALCQ